MCIHGAKPPRKLRRQTGAVVVPDDARASLRAWTYAAPKTSLSAATGGNRSAKRVLPLDLSVIGARPSMRSLLASASIRRGEWS